MSVTFTIFIDFTPFDTSFGMLFFQPVKLLIRCKAINVIIEIGLNPVTVGNGVVQIYVFLEFTFDSGCCWNLFNDFVPLSLEFSPLSLIQFHDMLTLSS